MHEHQWKALEDTVASYSCSCGATGRRNLAGRIVEGPAVSSMDPDDLITARPAMPDEIEDCTGRRRRLNPDNWRSDDSGEFDSWGANL